MKALIPTAFRTTPNLPERGIVYGLTDALFKTPQEITRKLIGG
ncbi:MAG: hypothetical protein U1A24_07365 [Cypionkella sp.]|nr:hypothetical protein [Cypionkella sp.]MDZ4310359.1 hypothetical protein [Cypionkella sp.]MDZ4391888.1 hypothetical protein [Cypionkella sp.]